MNAIKRGPFPGGCGTHEETRSRSLSIQNAPTQETVSVCPRENRERIRRGSDSRRSAMVYEKGAPVLIIEP